MDRGAERASEPGGRGGASLGRRVLRSAAIITLITVAYYAFPVPAGLGDYPRVIGATALALAGLALLIWLFRRRMREYRLASVRQTVGLEGLANAVMLLAVLFAGVYYALSRVEGQIEGIVTKTDALYFSVTTLATVGYGDIVATGQFARVVAMIQMLFDLVFIGTAIALVVSLRLRVDDASSGTT